MNDMVATLQNILDEKKVVNPDYSNRSFAKFLQENPSYLHKVLKREIKISTKKIYKYCKVMNFEKEQICKLLIRHLESESQQQSD